MFLFSDLGSLFLRFAVIIHGIWSTGSKDLVATVVEVLLMVLVGSRRLHVILVLICYFLQGVHMGVLGPPGHHFVLLQERFG